MWVEVDVGGWEWACKLCSFCLGLLEVLSSSPLAGYGIVLVGRVGAKMFTTTSWLLLYVTRKNGG